ncbi:hypothetical protein BZK31_16660 [Pseudomonas floridensis]|uniref:Uncharacterized protein n=1 Tax=Pseudomonas floridensis TaxID=1958950 RepID=A0A1X0N494_9PSED|nr:hypothetical protein [Pseudomonas floridensis]ORC58065.1 hypothetical protein BZK31_16660 [Pseudomonas floridensis]
MFVFEWILGRYKNLSWPGRCYAISTLIAFAAMLTTPLMGIAVLHYAVVLSSIGFIAGFMMWCRGAVMWMASVWDKPFGKTPVVILNLMVLLISTVLARWLVSVALGLPPQSFDVTVGFLALIFYLPAWMFIIASCLSVLGLVLLIVAGVGAMLSIPLGYMAAFLNMIGLQSYLRRMRERIAPLTSAFKDLLGHSAGAFFAGSILMVTYVELTSNFQPWVYSSVRLIAVISDFQPAANYPGVGAGEFIHPLENGFVAVAKEMSDHGMSITVKKQIEDFDSDPHPTIPSIPSFKVMMNEVSGGFTRE